MNKPIEAWKLTAYALGELEAEETEAIRLAIEEDPALQGELNETRRVIDRIQASLRNSTSEKNLTADQSAAIVEQIQHTSTQVNTSEAGTMLSKRHLSDEANTAVETSRNKSRLGLIALAASLLLAILIVPFAINKSSSLREIAIEQRADDGMVELYSPANTTSLNPSDPLASLESPSMTRPNSDMVAVGQPAEVDVNLPSIALGGVSSSQAGSAPSKEGITSLGEQVPKKDVEAYFADIDIEKKEEAKAVTELAINEKMGVDFVFNVGDHNPAQPTDLARANSALAANPADIKGGTNLTYELALNDEFAERGMREIRDQIESDLLSINAPPSAVEQSDFSGKNQYSEHSPPSSLPTRPSPSGDRYEPIIETPFVSTEQSPLSTFSIDVDTASYSKLRQYLMQANQLPQPQAVRIEELINYFEYDYAEPTDEHPFASNMGVAICPWNENHKLVRIGLQAKKVDVKERGRANLVFLLDVSGSMDEPNKLPLVKQAMTMLIRQLGENDRIAMVVYAGAAGCVLPSITGDRQGQILSALEELHAGGSTNGGQGIELAYSIATEHFIPGGINRVILCTDGDFNVGTTSNDALVKLVQEQAKSKVFLTCLGFGIGNYNDSMMEQITNQGNGVYGMVDNALEARRMMIEQLSGTLMTVAKDVKIQVEFNPTKIARYRLIGYENRRLANEDFNNDQKDAGEIGAGHRVTALYEIVPIGVREQPSVDELRYGPKKDSNSNPTPTIERPSNEEATTEWLTLKMRYKQPEGDVSSKREFYLTDELARQGNDDIDFRWSSAVAEFGLLLRHSQLAPQANWEHLLQRARSATGENPYRIECLEMMTKAKALSSSGF